MTVSPTPDHSPQAEGPIEHCRNALQVIMGADRTTVSGRVALTPEEYAGVCYRLERAIGLFDDFPEVLPPLATLDGREAAHPQGDPK